MESSTADETTQAIDEAAAKRPRRKPVPGSWWRCSTKIYSDPKLLRLSAAAQVLLLRSIAFCADHRTDGVLEKQWLPLVAFRIMTYSEAEECAQDFVREGHCTETADAYQFVNYLDWQNSAAEIDAARLGNAEAQKRWREKQKQPEVSNDAAL